MPFQLHFAKYSSILKIKGKTWNDLSFQKGGLERPWNAERSRAFHWNGYRVSILKTKGKTWNDCRSLFKSGTSPFTPPRFLERGVRCEVERKDKINGT